MITIRKGEDADLDAVLALIKELAEFEKASDQVSNTAARMRRERDFFDFFVAQNQDGELIGLALYFFAYYTWVGKSLYLDDLYVKPQYRGQKVGIKLLQEVLRAAKAADCQRLRWQVLDWNTAAIDFYKKVGVRTDNTWINCDLTQDQAAQLLREMDA